MVCFALLIFCLTFYSWYKAESIYQLHHQNEAREKVRAHLLAIRGRLEHSLISDLQLSKGLVASISLNPQISQKQFASVARTLFKDDSMLRNVAAAPNMKITLMYPLKGNEKAVGLDYRSVPNQFRTAEMARISRKVVLAGPVNLVQGGTAFIARVPIFLLNEHGQEFFWGLISSVIDKDKLFKSSGLLADSPIRIAIRGTDGMGAEGEVFFGDETIFANPTVTAAIELPVGSWQMAAVAEPGWFVHDHDIWSLRTGFLVLTAMVFAIFGLILYSLNSLSKAKLSAENIQQQLTESLSFLHEREALLKTVVDEIPDALLLKDADNTILLGNQAAARLYRTTVDDFIGKPESEFDVPEALANFFAEGLPENSIRSEDQILLQTEQQSRYKNRHFKAIKKSVNHSQLLILAQDISDIVQAQEQVIESEYKMRTILDNVDAYIYLKDTEGRYLFANRPVRDLWRAAMEEIIGSPDERFFDAATSENIRNNDARVLQHGETIRAEETNTVPETGVTATFQSTKLPLRREDGSIYALCGISVDISQLKNIEQALRESEQRFMIAGKAAYDLIYEWEVSSSSLTWFGDINTMLGYAYEKVTNELGTWYSLTHPDDRKIIDDIAERYETETEAMQFEYRIMHSDGNYRYWSDHCLPLLNDQGKPEKWIGVCKDITITKQHQEQLEYAAYHDKLTGLANRSLLADRLQQAMHQQLRRDQILAVVYLDLDGFKEINDAYGHDIGDRVLTALGKRFKQILREGDTIARLGGDEFVAVLIDIEQEEDSMSLLKRLQQTTTQPIEVDDLTLQVSSSLGVTFYPQVNDIEADQLIRQADQAMYQAKLAGKNRIHFFDARLEENIRGQRQGIEQIREAIAEGQLRLHYQPKVNMKTGKLLSVEALVRWQHPEQGLLMPADFLPNIEGHPLSIELGQWVRENAIAQLSEWKSLGLNISMSINISGLELQQNDFVSRLEALIARYPQVSAADLELEILETSALEDIEQVSAVMSACQAIGVKFALDDFGTGYSSLKYLKHLPAAVLKIDRTFVRDMLEDPDDLAILEGIMGMSNAFRRTVVAEGVEDLEHGNLLLQLGCELAQGYAIARPMPAAQLITWQHNWQPPQTWQQQQRINHDDFSLLFAAIEHKAWIQQIENYVRKGNPELAYPCLKNCRFGEWLKSEGRESYAGKNSFNALVTLHKIIHQQGLQACELLSQGHSEDAMQKIEVLYCQVDEMFLHLRKLLQVNDQVH